MNKKLFYSKKMTFPSDSPETISRCTRFIEDALRELEIDRKLILRTVLTAEEVVVRMMAHAAKGNISVRIRRLMGDAEIRILSEGDSFDLSGIGAEETVALLEMEDEDAERAIRSILLSSLGDRLKYSHKRGVNRVRIMAGQSEKSMLRETIVALVLGVVFGLLMKFVFPEGVSGGIGDYLLGPVKTMFMNALKIVIAPVVFFSIVSCIAQFKDLTELGRIGAKVMGMYLLTTFAAVLISVGMSILLHPGRPGFALALSTDPAAVAGLAAEVDTSLLHTIVNIVPDNFLSPFIQSDTLQIIFLAVMCGIAVGMLSEYSSVLQEFFEACNSLFLTFTTMITRFIPAAVFCSVALMMRRMDAGSLLSLLGMTGTHVLCIFFMLIVYGLLILVLGKLNPLTFYKKNKEGMITSFTLASSSAAMPVNMKTCTDKLGISSKVCSFSIPLGATVNMDGTCILLTVGSLFLARGYGVQVTQSMYLSLILTIVLLSLGAPGVPGSGLVCLGVVIGSLGVPLEAVGLVMGIYPFLDMFNTMSNTTGDVAASLIVAASEGLVDLEKYNA